MKYFVDVLGETVEVEVDGDHVTVSGRRRGALLTAIPNTPLHQLTVDGVGRTVALTYEDGGWTMLDRGRVVQIGVEDERSRQIAELTGRDGDRREGGVVVAPMPGLVLRVEVEVGQQVAPDTGVVVLEAMKMENEIRAGVVGAVRAVRVGPGDTVEKGTVLIELGAT